MLIGEQELPESAQTGDDNPSNLLLINHEARIGELEKSSHKRMFKRLTESASASALFLGLVLTLVSLHDVFISKPEADRISRLSQFNQAVNSAAKLRQELIKASFDGTSPQLQIAMISAVGPQVLNDIATARAMLRDLKNDDVGIPQLMILISEAFNIGDFEVAKVFVASAVAKTDVTPFLHSEAKRYEGRLFYATGNPVEGHKSFRAAMDSLGGIAASLPSRAYILAVLIIAEYNFGDCTNGSADFQSFVDMSKGLSEEPRQQIGAMLKGALLGLQGHPCPTPVTMTF